MPTLIVRGEWDSVCNDQDAATLLASIGTEHKRDCKIERATHLMHLETQRVALYQAVNDFLIGANP
jgi:esterase/lipase